jgi:hypothetical protein
MSSDAYTSVESRSPVDRPSPLRHEALIYGTEEEFLRGTLPFIRGAIDAGEPVKVVLPARRLAMVEEWIEDDGDVVEFVTMEAVGRNPARLISVWRDFVERHRDAARIRGVGEPAWADRSHDELVECCHHEALLNRAFEDGPEFRLLCPYDRLPIRCPNRRPMRSA